MKGGAESAADAACLAPALLVRAPVSAGVTAGHCGVPPLHRIEEFTQEGTGIS